MTIWVTIKSSWFKYHFDSAKLTMSETTNKGHRVQEGETERTWFHIKISNRRYVPARNVAVICTAIERFDGKDFVEESIPGNFPLQWVYGRKRSIRAIYLQDSVDLGFLFKQEDCLIFRIAMSKYQEKWNLPIEIRSDESGPSKMRIHLRIESDDFVSKNKFIYEIDLTKDVGKKYSAEMPIGKQVVL